MTADESQRFPASPTPIGLGPSEGISLERLGGRRGDRTRGLRIAKPEAVHFARDFIGNFG